MPRVLKHPLAELDLDEIWLYIAVDNQDIADRFLDEIDEKCRTLAELPKMGNPCPELAPDLRMFPIDNHIIFYELIENGVEIVRVIHGARDIKELFD